MDSPVCLRLHWIKAVPVFIRIHELKWPIASVTGLAQVSFDGLRATDVLAHLMAWIASMPSLALDQGIACVHSHP